jgi:hypothetical protein
MINAAQRSVREKFAREVFIASPDCEVKKMFISPSGERARHVSLGRQYVQEMTGTE